MVGLISKNGRFRTSGVVVFAGDQVINMSPPAKLLPSEFQNLITWYRNSKVHLLLKRAIFHYEFEFIHPFADGNGRMGRLWHSLLLGNWNEISFWMPIEELIWSRQKE